MWLHFLAFVKDHMDYLISSYDPVHAATNNHCKLYDELNLHLLSEKSLTRNNRASMITQITSTSLHDKLNTFIRKPQDCGNDHVISSLRICCMGLDMFQVDMTC